MADVEETPRFSPNSDHPKDVLPWLCRRFYYNGWMSGTGGALSMRHGNEVYITPSAVQKEMVEPEDLFVVSLDGEPISSPDPKRGLKMSTCKPNMLTAYKERGANVVLHLHNFSSVMATIVSPGKEFRLRDQNLFKGIQKGNSEQYHHYDDEIVLPIVENKNTEDAIHPCFERAIRDYPETRGLLIRRHGMYVWGPTWQKTKCMAECFDFLFETAIKMHQLGFDPAAHFVPPEGAYQ